MDERDTRSMLILLLAACNQTQTTLEAAAKRARHGLEARPQRDDRTHRGRTRRARQEDRRAPCLSATAAGSYGIAARNGILLINHYQHLEEQEGVRFGPGLVVRGAQERLSPILMTAGATALALVPLAAAGDIPGHEIEHPMAIVILGGLVTSTLLNLLVVPVLYLRFAHRRAALAGR